MKVWKKMEGLALPGWRSAVKLVKIGGVDKRRIKVLDVMPLPGRALMLLELDAPVPVPGLVEGMRVDLEIAGGTQQQALIKSLGFASSTPDHAHVVVTSGSQGAVPVECLEFEPQLGAESEPH